MEFKKIIIVLTITISVIIGLMFGVSYGWYAYSNAESNLSGSTIQEKPTIIFAQTEYIKDSKITPIYDEDKYVYANKNSFKIIIGENLTDYEVGVEIFITNIKMSEELKISNYKYELLQDGIVVSNGDFSMVGDVDTLKLLPITVLNPTSYPQTYNYELYIWLSEDESNQNSLMNKGFSAKIKVDSAVKKEH